MSRIPIVVGEDGLYLDMGRLRSGLAQIARLPELAADDVTMSREVARAVAPEMVRHLEELDADADDAWMWPADAVTDHGREEVPIRTDGFGGSAPELLARALAEVVSTDWSDKTRTSRRPEAPVTYVRQDGTVVVEMSDAAADKLVMRMMDRDMVRDLYTASRLLLVERPWPYRHWGYWSPDFWQYMTIVDDPNWRLSKWKEAHRGRAVKIDSFAIGTLSYFHDSCFSASSPSPLRDAEQRLGRGRIVQQGDPDWNESDFQNSPLRREADGTLVCEVDWIERTGRDAGNGDET